eukprot:766928-Hanusia_phi.AAC.3
MFPPPADIDRSSAVRPEVATSTRTSSYSSTTALWKTSSSRPRRCCSASRGTRRDPLLQVQAVSRVGWKTLQEQLEQQAGALAPVPGAHLLGRSGPSSRAWMDPTFQGHVTTWTSSLEPCGRGFDPRREEAEDGGRSGHDE